MPKVGEKSKAKPSNSIIPNSREREMGGLKWILDHLVCEYDSSTVSGLERTLQKENAALREALKRKGKKPENYLPIEYNISNCEHLQPRDARWLRRYCIPMDKFTTFHGEIGHGKTFWLALLCAAVQNGKWPDGEPCVQGDVLWLADEDDFEEIVLPRVIAAGGNGKQLHRMTARCGEDTLDIDLENNINHVKEQLLRFPNIKLIILDPGDSFFPGIDGWNNMKTRKALRPLRRLAEEIGITVVMSGHLNKGDRMAIDKAMGSNRTVRRSSRAESQPH